MDHEHSGLRAPDDGVSDRHAGTETKPRPAGAHSSIRKENTLMSEKKEDIKIDGKKEASELLAHLDPATRERILGEIRQKDPALAETLSKGLVSFSRILALDPAAFQKVVRSVPSAVLALAARGLTPDEETLLFSKLSGRQGESLRDERNAIGPRKKSEVDAARQKLAERAVELQASGEIELFTSPGYKKT
ncbi:MAG: hypothetical protein EBX52_03050 [Proteobacteria bacterium]|nr:hypothetical protein [Pseudomonadota bacterium]